MRESLNRFASGTAILGGLVQFLVAVSILFLPVFVTCQFEGHDRVCHGVSYVQQGGNALGYTFLMLMIVAGVLAVASSRDPNWRRAFFSRWLAALTSAVVFVVAGFGFGLAFAPGGLLVLLAALLTRPQGERSPNSPPDAAA